MFGKIAVAALALLTLGTVEPVKRAAASLDIAAACGPDQGSADWARAAPPAHIHGKTWYVGTCGITVVLVETKAGLVLIDTGPEDAVPHVLASIKALGFDPKQVKWILSTHEHFDHAGGIAIMQRRTGARLAVGPISAPVLRTGKPFFDDPQFELLKDHQMPNARVDRILPDGRSLIFGAVAFTAHGTPAHSPGSTSWTWRSCQLDKCITIALADSISTISSDQYRFTAHPEWVRVVRRGLTKIGTLPCDLIVTPHPSSSNLFERLSGRATLIDPAACKTYAEAGTKRFDQRLQREASAK